MFWKKSCFDTKGIWRTLGGEGVWDEIKEDTAEVDDKRIEEDGEGFLIEQAVDAKLKFMTDAIDAADKTRQEKTVEAPRMSLQEILSLAGFSCKDAVCDVIDQAGAVDVNKEGEDGEGEKDGR